MRRRLFTGVVMLTAGAIVSILVAWSSVLLVDIQRAPDQLIYTDMMAERGGFMATGKRSRLGYTQSITRLIRPASFGVSADGSHMIEFPQTPFDFDIVQLRPGETLERDYPDLHEALTSGTGDIPAGTIAFWPWETQAGWPMRSMRCWHENLVGVPSSRSMATSGPVTIQRGILVGSPTPPQLARALPLQPMWAGFLVNTLFYAVWLGLLLPGAIRLRRWNRLRRKLCPACAYPIGVNPVCTECGHALPVTKM